MKYSKLSVVALVLMGLGAVKTSFAEDNGAAVKTTVPAVGTIGVNANVTTPDANNTADRRNRNEIDADAQRRAIRNDNDRVEYRGNRYDNERVEYRGDRNDNDRVEYGRHYRMEHGRRVYMSVSSDCDESNAIPVSAQVRIPAATDRASVPASYEQNAPNPNKLQNPNTSTAPTPLNADTQNNTINPNAPQRTDTGTELNKPVVSPDTQTSPINQTKPTPDQSIKTAPDQTAPAGNTLNDVDAVR